MRRTKVVLALVTEVGLKLEPPDDAARRVINRPSQQDMPANRVDGLSDRSDRARHRYAVRASRAPGRTQAILEADRRRSRASRCPTGSKCHATLRRRPLKRSCSLARHFSE